ncbi:DUF4352 domain-containing protein [Nonomuraea sp. NPDC050394]|uniref:DUF4352 domain-containing protein n=1 Tax=Nonomuraea sp. NPDC050394 TaxID=3364363 RepID=UPI0037A0FA68
MSYQPYGQQPTHAGPTPQPYPPQYNGYAYGMPPPAPPKKSNRAFLLFCIGAAVVVLGVLGAAVVVASNGPAAKQAGIGEAVRDGDLSMVVAKVERRDRVGSVRFGKDAQGEFVLVHLSVQNNGSRSATFAAASQKLLAGGAEYKADGAAGVYLRESNLLFERINPGNMVMGVIVFDVPRGTQIDSIELHDSVFSRGAKVSLQ